MDEQFLDEAMELLVLRDQELKTLLQFVQFQGGDASAQLQAVRFVLSEDFDQHEIPDDEIAFLLVNLGIWSEDNAKGYITFEQ